MIANNATRPDAVASYAENLPTANVRITMIKFSPITSVGENCSSEFCRGILLAKTIPPNFAEEYFWRKLFLRILQRNTFGENYFFEFCKDMNISRDDIKGNYSEALVTNLCSLVAVTGDFLGFVHEYMYDDDPIVVRNALSALTKATDDELSQLNPIRDELIDMVIRSNNSSIRRNLLNILLRLEMNEEDVRTDFLDHCLSRMSMPDEVPSVQALCMKLAYRMCRFYPELIEELKRTLEAMEISYYPPAVRSVWNKILHNKLKI